MHAARSGIRVLLVVGVAGIATGCAATRQVRDQDGRPDVLTREQIREVQGARNLHDVVQRLRPRWLTVRAANRSLSGAAAEIVVYENQSFLGGVDALRQLGLAVAYELRYLDGTTAAATLPGLGAGRHVAGAIVVITHPPDA